MAIAARRSAGGPIHEVPIFGDDAALRDDRTIRVTDMAFDEDVLLDQDRLITAVLSRPEFQKRMTGTELRYRLGEFYAEQEQRNRVAAGPAIHLLRMEIPVFVGAPGDGSVFLNSMKLWAMKQAGIIPDYASISTFMPRYSKPARITTGDCSKSANAMATLILGGGVPKNYNLQPEPALGQVLGLPNVRGYNSMCRS